MREIKDEVKIIIQSVKEKAINKNGKFNSIHEAWAVTEEEIQEVDEILKRFTTFFEKLKTSNQLTFDEVKHDNINQMLSNYKTLYLMALNMCAELIQVLAMFDKSIDYLKIKSTDLNCIDITDILEDFDDILETIKRFEKTYKNLKGDL